ncbi:MAG TPA: hypothetical protein VFF59_00455 [Anaerolineae bacterium]|nr:hypothetical protein [Anaerolineae bacterium]
MINLNATLRYEAVDLRRALFATLDLYHWLAIETAQRLGLAYPAETQRQVAAWLKTVRAR